MARPGGRRHDDEDGVPMKFDLPLFAPSAAAAADAVDTRREAGGGTIRQVYEKRRTPPE